MEPAKLDELAASLSRRGAPLTPESAVFIVMECVDALQSAQRVLSAEGVLLGGDGVVTLVEEALSPALDDAEVARGAVAMLESLLLSPSAGVLDLAARVRAGEVASRAAMLAELNALLVPFNRGAARRMLGRLVREHQREAEGAALPEVSTEAPPVDDTPVADATWLERSEGPLAHLSATETSPDDAPKPRRDDARTKGLAMVGLSALAVLGAAWFLWSRL